MFVVTACSGVDTPSSIPSYPGPSWTSCAAVIARHPTQQMIASPANNSTIRLHAGGRVPLSLTQQWMLWRITVTVL
jgi:hypothetical protein